MLQKDITPPRVGSIVESQICPRERFSLIAAVWIVSVVCVCAIAVADPDLWGHTLYGLRSIQQGVLTEKADPYSFTAPGHRWVNHEWLSEYIYGWTWQNFGDAGLWCWRNLMVVGLFAIAAAVMDRARAGVAASIVLLIYSAMCLGSFCALVRPDDYQSELALLPCHIRGCEYRDARRDWIKLYEDDQAVLFVRDVPKFRALVSGKSPVPATVAETVNWNRFPAGPRNVPASPRTGPPQPAAAQNVHSVSVL